ncbi:MAG: hypothetical protein KDA67_03235 [Rhodobacteraceae bacterium]|nr:hypothetical protein [Paracoccaceae bacterium]
MPNYLFAFHGGHRFATKKEGQAHMAAWMAWIKNTGDALVNNGQPLGPSWTVGKSGATEGAENAISGYAVVAVDNIDAAIAIAKACPHTNIGTIEVAEEINM